VSFAERGGWWVVGQLALMVVYAVALVGTDPVSEGIGLGFARGTGLVLVGVAVILGVWAINLIRDSISIFPAPARNGKPANSDT